jgi:fatty acid desaturase
MANQDYQPYRSALLSKEELADLHGLNFTPVVIHIAVLWVQIVLAWAVAALFPSWWVVVLGAAVVGNRYYSLFIIGHDGLHRRLHPRRGVNDFVNDVFVLGPLGAITRINRANHMRHHMTLGCPDDPDAYKYASRWTQGTSGYLLSMTGIPYVYRALRAVYAGRSQEAGAHGERYGLRDIAIIAGWQILLIAALTWAFGWWGYFVMWWIPVYIFTFVADITRVFCEHSAETVPGGSVHERLVTFMANRVELLLFAPMNMNHHVAHHLWPSIPYYNLPKATRILYARAAGMFGESAPQVRRSYFAYLFRGLRRASAAEPA